MNKLISQKIETFLVQLGSGSPTPGGGSAAAIVGAMAASLVQMVANLTIGKKRYIKAQKQSTEISSKAKYLSKKLSDLALLDSDAFAEVIKACRTKDNAKIKKALKKAIEIPEKVYELSKQVESLAKTMAKIGNKNAYSDAKSAMHLARAAYLSAQENIKINQKALAALK